MGTFRLGIRFTNISAAGRIIILFLSAIKSLQSNILGHLVLCLSVCICVYVCPIDPSIVHDHSNNIIMLNMYIGVWLERKSELHVMYLLQLWLYLDLDGL